MSIEQKVIDIIAEKLDIKDKAKIVLGASFKNDLGADSLDQVELVMELEKEYGLTIPDDAATKMLTVGDAISFIKANIKEAPKA
ncbi:MAG: acyl carrier protein [Alphaproteobacteria bacterium]|nr:acyl carrier protein [Alphaproteobacteria bacterium]